MGHLILEGSKPFNSLFRDEFIHKNPRVPANFSYFEAITVHFPAFFQGFGDLQGFKTRRRPPRPQRLRLVLAKECNVKAVPAPVTVVGDVHGQVGQLQVMRNADEMTIDI